MRTRPITHYRQVLQILVPEYVQPSNASQDTRRMPAPQERDTE